MDDLSLQFEGVENLHLLGALGLAIALAVIGCGVWKFFIRRQRVAGAVPLIAGVIAATCVVAATSRVELQTAAGKLLWLLLLGAVIMLAVAVFYSAVYAYLGRRRLTTISSTTAQGSTAGRRDHGSGGALGPDLGYIVRVKVWLFVAALLLMAGILFAGLHRLESREK